MNQAWLQLDLFARVRARTFYGASLIYLAVKGKSVAERRLTFCVIAGLPLETE